MHKHVTLVRPRCGLTLSRCHGGRCLPLFRRLQFSGCVLRRYALEHVFARSCLLDYISSCTHTHSSGEHDLAACRRLCLAHANFPAVSPAARCAGMLLSIFVLCVCARGHIVPLCLAGRFTPLFPVVSGAEQSQRTAHRQRARTRSVGVGRVRVCVRVTSLCVNTPYCVPANGYLVRIRLRSASLSHSFHRSCNSYIVCERAQDMGPGSHRHDTVSPLPLFNSVRLVRTG